MEALWVTMWLAIMAVAAWIGWNRTRSVETTMGALLIGLVVGTVVVAVAQFSLVAVAVGALFLTVWVTLFGLVHRLGRR